MARYSHNQSGFSLPAFRASVARAAPKQPTHVTSFHIKPIQACRTFSNNFSRQADLSRQFARLGAAIPKVLPKTSSGFSHDRNRSIGSPTSVKFKQRFDLAIKAQDRLVKHQDHVKHLVANASRATRATLFKSAFVRADKPWRTLNHHLGETKKNVQVLHSSARATYLQLNRNRNMFDKGRPYPVKPIPGSRFAQEARLHRKQVTLLGRIAGIFDRFRGTRFSPPKRIHDGHAGGRAPRPTPPPPSKQPSVVPASGSSKFPGIPKQDQAISRRLAQDDAESPPPNERRESGAPADVFGGNRLPSVEETHAANQTTRAADQILANDHVRVVRAVQSDLRDIASSVGDRAQGPNGEWGVTIERSNRHPPVFYGLESRETIMPVLADLGLRSTQRDESMVITSLFRPGTGLHGQLRAVDLNRYAGHRFHENQPEQTVRGLEALLEDLPPGEYAIGLPRLSSLHALGAERDALDPVYRGDYEDAYNTPSGPLPTDERRGEHEQLIPIDGLRVPASRVEQKIAQIRNPELRGRIQRAYDGALARGVRITGLFADKSGHLHLSRPVGPRM